MVSWLLFTILPWALQILGMGLVYIYILVFLEIYKWIFESDFPDFKMMGEI